MTEGDETTGAIRGQANHRGRRRDGGLQSGRDLPRLRARKAYVRLEAGLIEGAGTRHSVGYGIPGLLLPLLSAASGGNCRFYRTFRRVMI